MHKTLLLIRITAVALLLSVSVSMGADSQNGTIQFSKSQLTVREVFAEIQAQTGYGIAFNGKLLDASRVVNLTSQNIHLDDAMDAVLEGQKLDYAFAGKVITIVQKAETPKPVMAAVQTPLPRETMPVPVIAPVIVPVEQEPAAVTEPVVEPVSKYTPMEKYVSNHDRLPHVGLKTNVLYGAATLTPNLALEVGLGRKTSLELAGSYNPWNLKGSLESNKKLVHMIVKPEFRYWFCERFNGHFLGVDAIFARYNIGSREVPMLFEKEYRYDGVAYGAGISYGYQWMLGKQWGIEAVVGAGVLMLDYDRYDCAACDRNAKPLKKTYFGPTNAAINLIFLIK